MQTSADLSKLPKQCVLRVTYNKDFVLQIEGCFFGNAPSLFLYKILNLQRIKAQSNRRHKFVVDTLHLIPYTLYLFYMFIDTHAHLYQQDFKDDLQEIVERAQENGIGRIILPDIDSKSRNAMLETEARYPDLMCSTIGLHPTSVDETYQQELGLVEKMLGKQKFYAIGECGIDLYWDKSHFKEQVKAFEHQLGIAEDMHLPVIIHARESLAEIFTVLKKHTRIQGVFHCFPGNEADAERACGMGFFLGIGGVATFKNSHLDKVIRHVGIAHILLETDAPYLAPVPHRGKRNESAYIPLIAEKIAEITELPLKKIEDTTTQNATKLFNLQTF